MAARWALRYCIETAVGRTVVLTVAAEADDGTTQDNASSEKQMDKQRNIMGISLQQEPLRCEGRRGDQAPASHRVQRRCPLGYAGISGCPTRLGGR